MFVLGVTGPSGAGKGEVCRYLTTHGFFHIDTDRLVPGVYPAAIPALTEAFGDTVVRDGAVDKKELARIAFSSPENTDRLNRIIHPLVVDKVRELLNEADKNGFHAAVIDGAALFEAQADRLCDRMLCVLAPEEMRYGRILQRDRIDGEAARRRISAQKDNAFYSEKCDRTLINDSDLPGLYEKINILLKEWKL